jgi:hypothetical protein
MSFMRERILHMRGVNVRVRALYIDRGATETACPAVWKLRRHPEMGIVHGVFGPALSRSGRQLDTAGGPKPVNIVRNIVRR